MVRSYRIAVEQDLPVPMRDGTVLRADLYRPAGAGRRPVLLMRTPYGKSGHVAVYHDLLHRAVGHGYAIVVQDTRGRCASDGVFVPFVAERLDGVDTAAWIGDQRWADGRLGMFGASYAGATQWEAAHGDAPGLRAIVPDLTSPDYRRDWIYPGGVFALNFVLSWTLSALATETVERRIAADPNRAPWRDALWDRIDAMGAEFARMPLAGDPLLRELAPYYDAWLEHPEADRFWEPLAEPAAPPPRVAALHIGGWYDLFLRGTLAGFARLTAAAKAEQRLLIGPWTHLNGVVPGPAGDVDFGVRAEREGLDLAGVHLRFFDRHLRGLDLDGDPEPPVRFFVVGEGRWREASAWPPPGTMERSLFLASDGVANTAAGDGRLVWDVPPTASGSADRFTYDPLDPVPTRGGALCCHLAWSRAGAFDQREVEARPDMLCYTTAPLAEPLTVVGPVGVEVFAASTAVATDWTAKLVDVHPCGCALNLADGIVRARTRRDDGTVSRNQIDLGAVAVVLEPGHRLRLEISSSNFPRFARNPNSGAPPATARPADCRPAHQTVHHDDRHPSRLVLMVVNPTA